MTTFKHSGNAGDIIYIIPTIAQFKDPVLYLNLDRPADYAAGLNHPLKNVMLNEATARMLFPLCEAWNIECYLWNDDPIQYDLDKFREHGINLSGYDIRRWIMAEYPELRPPVPYGRYSPEMNNPYVTVNLSERYRNSIGGGNDKWAMLNELSIPVKFIGVESEFIKFQQLCPNAVHEQVADFKQMADVICGGLFHFGNQSSPFAVAEIYDHFRALEISPYCPNVVSEGSHWQVIYTNDNMRWIIDTYLSGYK
jgi:hypothetical protein